MASAIATKTAAEFDKRLLDYLYSPERLKWEALARELSMPYKPYIKISRLCREAAVFDQNH